jgi:hypothetical protein
MVISVAVVTKRTGFTLTMHTAGHRFTEVRPVAGWLERRMDQDVLLLDLETPKVAAEAVATLRSSGTVQPIIVVGNETDGWDAVIADHPDLLLVSVPVTRTSLLSTVDRAARLSVGMSAATTASRVAVATEEVSAGAATVPASARHPAASSPDPQEPTFEEDPVHLARQLRRLVGRLRRVPEVAEDLRQRCVSAVPCEASAVLVRDGDVWRVAAGEHLRALEERLQISSRHWLVSEVVGLGHGVLIRDTDIVRSRLSGAPLAAWPNLMALPVSGAEALLLLARQVKEFTRGDLATGERAIGPVVVRLGGAVDVRDLARTLSPFANPVE